MRKMSNHTEAKEMIEGSIQARHQIKKGYFLEGLSKPCPVEFFKIAEVQGLLEMTLTYREQKITKDTLFIDEVKTETLIILTGAGDRFWPYTMKMKVWEGGYPSNVAINKSTGEVFFVRYVLEGMLLESFCELEETELDAILNDISRTKPYRLGLDAEAMFQYIGEQEGCRVLREGVEIEFDCGVKIVKQLGA